MLDQGKQPEIQFFFPGAMNPIIELHAAEPAPIGSHHGSAVSPLRFKFGSWMCAW